MDMNKFMPNRFSTPRKKGEENGFQLENDFTNISFSSDHAEASANESFPSFDKEILPHITNMVTTSDKADNSEDWMCVSFQSEASVITESSTNVTLTDSDKTIKKKYRKRKQYAHGNKGKVKIRQNVISAKSFINMYADKHGHYMPHKKHTNMPSYMNRKCFYQEYQKSSIRLGEAFISRASFYRLLRKHFNFIKFPKADRFSHCKDCFLIAEESGKLDKEGRERIEETRKEHESNYVMAREKYEKHKRKCEENPSKYMSIYMDGMDSGHLQLPRMYKNTKDTSSAYKMPIYLVGCLLHFPKTLEVFLESALYKHDSNLTLNLILSCLRRKWNTHGQLGETLYIQMDNCVRECKNKYIYAFCWMLVKWKIFKKVKLSFMIVGHTHYTIDRLFSQLSVKLKKRDTITINDLNASIKDVWAAENVQEPTVMQKIVDISKWLEPHIAPNLHNHLHTRCVIFKEGPNSNILQFHRRLSHGPTKSYDVFVDFMKSYPNDQDIPQFSTPVFDRFDQKRFHRDLQKGKHEYQLKSLGSLEWWDDFLAKRDVLKAEFQEAKLPSLSSWSLLMLKKCVQEKKVVQEQKRKSEVEELVAKRVNAESCPVQIYVGPYDKRKKPLFLQD